MFEIIISIGLAVAGLFLFFLSKQNKGLSADLSVSRQKIQALLEDVAKKDVLMERGAQALSTAAIKHQDLLNALTTTKQALEFQQAQYANLLGQKKSSEVRTGKITEQISPFLKDYPLNPNTARFVGDPIDFVHFDEDMVSFVEVKSGKSQLSKKQKHIGDLITAGKVQFLIYRVKGEDDGTDKS